MYSEYKASCVIAPSMIQILDAFNFRNTVTEIFTLCTILLYYPPITSKTILNSKLYKKLKIKFGTNIKAPIRTKTHEKVSLPKKYSTAPNKAPKSFFTTSKTMSPSMSK